MEFLRRWFPPGPGIFPGWRGIRWRLRRWPENWTIWMFRTRCFRKIRHFWMRPYIWRFRTVLWDFSISMESWRPMPTGRNIRFGMYLTAMRFRRFPWRKRWSGRRLPGRCLPCFRENSIRKWRSGKGKRDWCIMTIYCRSRFPGEFTDSGTIGTAFPIRCWIWSRKRWILWDRRFWRRIRSESGWMLPACIRSGTP